jgi:hypothetical protein
MATTTNYGWTTPDDTALVKDGASAIRTLGSSVDTTTKALNPETTLGDLAYRSSTANVKTRLGLGTAGQVLTVNSGATAPEWATAGGGGLTLISTVTASNQASVTFSSIPATYKHLQVVIKNFDPTTDNDSLWLRFNSDSNANRYISQTTSGNALSFSLSESNCTFPTDNTTTQNLYNLFIPDYTNTTTWKIYTSFGIVNVSASATQAYVQAMRTGAYNQTGAITALTFITGNANNIVSGTFELYGVK